jgi:hypothetical protein
MVILTSIPENPKFQMSGSLHPCQPLKRWGGCSLAGLRTGHGWREISGVFPITKKIAKQKSIATPQEKSWKLDNLCGYIIDNIMIALSYREFYLG